MSWKVPVNKDSSRTIISYYSSEATIKPKLLEFSSLNQVTSGYLDFEQLEWCFVPNCSNDVFSVTLSSPIKWPLRFMSVAVLGDTLLVEFLRNTNSMFTTKHCSVCLLLQYLGTKQPRLSHKPWDSDRTLRRPMAGIKDCKYWVKTGTAKVSFRFVTSIPLTSSPGSPPWPGRPL